MSSHPVTDVRSFAMPERSVCNEHKLDLDLSQSFYMYHIRYQTEKLNEVREDYSYSKTPVQIQFHTRFDIWIDFRLNLSEISESLSFDLQGFKNRPLKTQPRLILIYSWSPGRSPTDGLLKNRKSRRILIVWIG